MGHYRSNLRDLEFNLELFGAKNLLGTGPFAALDAQSASDVLREVDNLATNDLADSYGEADRNPPQFDPTTHAATLPEAFKKSYRRLMEGEWYRLELPEALGGYAAPPSLRWAVAELLLGANPPAYMYMSGGSFANVLYQVGTQEQREFAKVMVDKQWAATMVLTEPDAGSDVGAGRTKATEQPDGSWHLEGVKRFITSGEHDLADNIIHFVLARPVGAGPGTKGLSMFMVPKFMVNADGELGERNGVYATNVEHKMGIKASTTCELTFGADHPAVGFLVGGVHDGIRQMFRVIEYARMLVGTKAIAALSTGYLNALDYAKGRVQGPDLTQAGDASAARVAITAHPDVRRSLLRQKSYAEGLRALVMFTASLQDAFVVAEFNGDAEAAAAAHRLNDLLLPVLKGCGSERSYELLGSETLQTFGGSGYLQDYPIEQYVRDAKIDTLYEGTTAIQGQDLFFRKILRDKGQALGALAGQIQEFVTAAAQHPQLGSQVQALGKAAGEVQRMIGVMSGWAQASHSNPRDLYKIGLNTTRLLLSLGDVVIGWLLLRQAVAGAEVLAAGADADKDFYLGKLAGAKFFATTVFPEITARRIIVENTDLDAMDLPLDAF